MRKVVTAYSGNSFPTYTPNPVFRQAYESGEVEVEHWSILTLVAAPGGCGPGSARGGDRVVGRVVHGRERGLHRGRLAVRPARTAGAPGARRGTGPRRRGRSRRQPRLLRAAARRRVGSVGGTPWRRGDGRAGRRRPRGARAPRPGPGPSGPRGGGGALRRAPGRLLRARRCPCAATERTSRTGARWPTPQRGTSSTTTSENGCSARPRTRTTCSLVGSEQLLWLGGRSDPMSWKADADANPVVRTRPSPRGSRRRPSGPARSSGSWPTVGADAVLAGAGVANLSAWVAVARARAAGSKVLLTAELGLWGYEPTPADPYIFNQRRLPRHPVPLRRIRRPRHGDRRAGHDDGGVPRRSRGRRERVPELDRAGRRAVPGRLGRCQRRRQPGHGVRGGHPGPARTAAPRRVAYVTSPGQRVASVVTDKGVLRRDDGVLRLAAVPAGDGTLEDRVRAFVSSCGYEPEVARQVEELPAVTASRGAGPAGVRPAEIVPGVRRYGSTTRSEWVQG